MRSVEDLFGLSCQTPVKKKNGKGPSANNGSRSGTEYQMEDDYYDEEEPEEDPEY